MRSKPSSNRLLYTLSSILVSIGLILPQSASGVIFIIKNKEVVGPQTLLNPQDELIIKEKGVIFGGAANAVTMNNILQKTINKGLIGTTGDAAFGITSRGLGNLLENRGTIVTLGSTAHGMDSRASFNTLRNSGTILTSGDFSRGINVAGVLGPIASPLIENSGKILLTGNNSIGILLAVANNGAILNRGIIRTTGIESGGIATFALGPLALENRGLIDITGPSSLGILFNNGGSTFFTNSGTIRVPTGEAIRFQSANYFLSLLRGSNIQGAVVLTGGGTRAIEVQKGLNLALTNVGNSWTTVDAEGNPFVLSGNTLAVVDRTGFAIEVDILDDLTASILNQRKCYNCCACSCNEYFDFDNSTYAKQGWVGAFGSYRKRDRQHRIVSYDNGFGGFIGGLELTCFSDMELGVFGGGTAGKADVAHHIHRILNYSGFGGLSACKAFGDTFVDLTVAGGLLVQDSKRRVMNNLAEDGKEQAKADFRGGFVAPELTLGHCFSLFGMQPLASFKVRYAGLFLDKYKEKGSLADLKVLSRDLHIITTAAELALPLSFPCFGYNLAMTPYLAIEGRFRLGDRHLHGELLNQSITFTDGSDDTLGALYFGLRGCHTLECGPSLFLNIEGSVDNKKSALIRGEIDLTVPF